MPPTSSTDSIMILRNRFHQTALVPGKEGEVLDEIQKTCRLAEPPKHHFQRHPPRLVLPFDPLPLRESIPLRRQRTYPAVGAVRSDQERVVPKERGDSVLQMLVARQVFIECLPSRDTGFLKLNHDK